MCGCNNELWWHIETNWTSWYFILKRMLQLHPVDRKCTGLRVWIKSAQFFQSLDFAHFCLAYYKSNHIQLNYIDRRRKKLTGGNSESLKVTKCFYIEREKLDCPLPTMWSDRRKVRPTSTQNFTPIWTSKNLNSSSSIYNKFMFLAK